LLATQLRAGGASTLAVAADLTDATQANDAVERAVSVFGSLDILVNNAGMMLLGPAERTPLQEWQQMVDINLLGVLYCTHAALPHLLRAADHGPRGVADIVTISSVMGRETRTETAVYNATKFGVGAFSDSLRTEFSRRHVRASLVEPGGVITELSGHNRPEVLAGIERRNAAITRLDPADVADVVGYVVSRPRHIAINEVLVRPTTQEE
jgi:NADP-dependent 3-hydroxy acid dehydrogenase YdfG